MDQNTFPAHGKLYHSAVISMVMTIHTLVILLSNVLRIANGPEAYFWATAAALSPLLTKCVINPDRLLQSVPCPAPPVLWLLTIFCSMPAYPFEIEVNMSYPPSFRTFHQQVFPKMYDSLMDSRNSRLRRGIRAWLQTNKTGKSTSFFFQKSRMVRSLTWNMLHRWG